MTTCATMVRGLFSRIGYKKRSISGRTLRRRLRPLAITSAIEGLESRALLTTFGTDVTISGGDLVVTDILSGGQADTLTLQSDTVNSQFVIFDPSQNLRAEGIAGAVVSDDLHTVRVPFSSITGNIRVDTLEGDDNLTIDYSLGDFNQAVSFNGGTQTSASGDSLTLVGGTFAAGTFSFADENSGTIDISGNAQISYAGLEPIVTTGTTIDDLIFTYSGGDETIALTDAGGNNLTIDSTLGESVTFSNPGSSLTINAGSGYDIINITSVNAAYDASLTINGDDGDDLVNLDAGITFASDRNLDVNLQNDGGEPGTDTIHVGQNALYQLSGTGTATLAASSSIALASGSSVFTVDGNLTIEANQQAVSTAVNAIGVDVNGALILSSGTGQVTVRGRGGDESGGFQYGVQIANGGIIAGGTMGLLTVQGTADAGTGYLTYGVLLTDTGSTITSVGADVSVSGTGGGMSDFGINYGVAVQAGAQITAEGGGAVTVEGIGSNTTSIFSSNYGVYLTGTGSSIRSNGGNLSVIGTGGGTDGDTGEFSSNYGVSVQAAAQIAAGGSGAVSIAAIGSRITGDWSSNFGVYVTDSNSIIASSGGAVSIFGDGGGSGVSSSNYGIAVQAAGQIMAGDLGVVSIEGNGGHAAGDGSTNFGVFVTDTDSRITSNGGDVSVTGFGGGKGDYSSNYGVAVQAAAQIVAGLDGTVAVAGIGGDLAQVGSSNFGVYITDGGSSILSGGNDVLVTGIGGGIGEFSSNYGVAVQAAAQIAAGGGGAVAVSGIGGSTTGDWTSNYGVFVLDSNISSGGGDVSVAGIAGATGNFSFNFGVLVQAAGQITAGETGAVSVMGTGGNTTDSDSTNYGVLVSDSNSIIHSSGGDVSVSGAAGGAGSSFNYGVAVQVAGRIAAAVNGTVSVVGTGGDTTDSASINYGVFVTDSNSLITSSGGDVSVTGIEGEGSTGIAIDVENFGSIDTAASGGKVALIGDSMRFDDTATITASGSSSVTLRQFTDVVSIDLGTAIDIKGGPLGLSDAELDRVMAGTITIGDVNSGTITVSADIAHPPGADFQIVSGGDIVISGGQFDTGGGSLLLKSGPAPTSAVRPIHSGVDVVASRVSIDGQLAIVINGPTIDTQFTQLNVAGEVDLTSASLVLSGTYTPTAADSFVIVNNDDTDAVVGTFNGLPEGTVVVIKGVQKLTTYVGGDGNDVALNLLGAPEITLTAPDVVYSGNPYTFTVATMKGITGVSSSTLEDVGLVVTYYLGSTATGTPIAPPTNVETYTVVASFAGSVSYLGTTSTPVIFHILKADPTIVITPYSVTYDGIAHTATGTATGVQNESLSGLDLTGTTHTNAGTYTDLWTFTDTTGNYNDASGTVIDTIAKANATIVVTPYNVTYDAAAHTATGTVKGVLNEDLSGLDLTGTTHTNAGTYTNDPWTFTDTTGNYNDASGTVIDTIAKANATIVVTPYNVTYDAAAHTATGTATGVQNESLSGLDLTGTTHINAGTYTNDPWTFTDTTGNYNDASGTVIDTIAKADATIVVTPYNVTYDAAAHTATGTVKGVLNEDLSGLDLTGTTHTNAGTYTNDPWTFTDTTGNYNDASGTVIDTIAKADATIIVTPYNVLYDATPHTAVGTAKGVLNETLSGLVLTGTTHTNAGLYPTDPWSFTDTTGNYNNASGTVVDRIVMPASLKGYVYDDENNDGLRTGEVAIAGVTVTLTGTDDLGASVSVVKTTNSSGLYQFAGLRPGTYVLTETQPVGYFDGKDTIGTPGGTMTNDKFSGIALNEGVNGTENNFGEIGATINGMKYLDVTGNGLSADDTPLAGATFRLYFDANGNNTLDSGDGAALSSTTSDCDGTFSFGSLPQGVYFVQEVAMAGYVRTGPTLTDYYMVNAQAGSDNGVYKFANAELGCDCSINTSSIKYYINGSSAPVTDLRGRVNSGDRVEARFNVTGAGATFSLVSYTAPGSSFDANTASQQTIFDTDSISNASLGPHSLFVLVPNSYFQIDFVCGLPIDKFGPAGSNIFYSPQDRLFSADNDGSQPYATSTLSGYVYRDKDNDGNKDSGEVGIANVTLKLSGKDIQGNTVSATVKTNSSGYYAFSNLKASDLAGYKITETQPAGYKDGKDKIGSLGGTVVNDKLTTYQLNSNQSGLNYNFGERPYSQVIAGAGVSEGESALFLPGSSLLTGEILVAVEGLSADQGVEQLARISDAIAVLNAQLASYDVSFVLFSGASADAEVHLQFADSSELGGVAEGILGVTNGTEITLINGWNWHLGADSTSITTSQFDFQTVVTHEFGHVLGMGHSTDISSVLFAELASGQVRHSLSDTDLALIGEEETGEEPEALRAAPSASPTAAISHPSMSAVPFAVPPASLFPRTARQDMIALDANSHSGLLASWEAMNSTHVSNTRPAGRSVRAKDLAGKIASDSRVSSQKLETAQLDEFFSGLGTGQSHLSSLALL